jgi:uncharacterized protein
MNVVKIISAVLALMAMVLIGPVSAEDAKVNRMISVTGHGEVNAVPDLASISIGVVTSADTPRDALDENSKAMNKLMELFKKSGIEAKDLTTSNFSVGPRYDYNAQPQKLIGYEVNNTVTVTVRKIDDLGALLDVAVSNGSNQINSISFSVSKPEAMLDEARKAAVADARRKAEIYAAAGGFALGDIISLSEGAPQGPRPVMAVRMKEASAYDDAPIAQGEQTLELDVSITYAIK